MEYVINRADYRRNKLEVETKKSNINVEKIYRYFVFMMFCLLIGIGGISSMNLKQKKLETDAKKSLLISEVKNETNYEFDKVPKKDSEAIEKLIIPCVGTVTSRYGFRNSSNPIVSSNHMGIDIGAPKGTDIFAAHDGVVIEAGQIGSYGKCVMIQNEKLITVYAHCSKLHVKNGDNVKQKDKIAEVGMTGNATGNHLHFEVRYNGECINPEDVIDWL